MKATIAITVRTRPSPRAAFWKHVIVVFARLRLLDDCASERLVQWYGRLLAEHIEVRIGRGPWRRVSEHPENVRASRGV